MTTYQIQIFRNTDDPYVRNEQYAHAFGDLETIAYIAKKASAAIADVPGNITLALNETDAIGGQAVREVVAVTANAKVVATVLKGELTSERKAAKSAPVEPEPNTADSDEHRADDDPDLLPEPTDNDTQY